MTGQADLAVPASDGDAHVDFCLWDYAPLADPAAGWRSETILYHSFAEAGVLEAGRAFVEAIRDAFGPFTTVWGIKDIGGALAWEFYFYDYGRTARRRSAARFLQAVAARHPPEVTPPEARPYFMFSVPFRAEDFARGRAIRELDVYIGNPGSSVSSGICYLLTGSELRLKNFYFFFDAETERAQAMRKLTTSVFLDEGGIWPAALAWPEMMVCKTVVVANKSGNDALYFSRVNVDQLVWFLDRVAFPRAIAGEVARNRDRYRHLYFDVGYDFEIFDGTCQVVKTSFYGYV